MSANASETTFAPAGESLRLQGEIIAGGEQGVVICHPHPLFGGTMDSVVVGALFDVAGRKGHSALRFNFRGVGRSEGTHGEGRAEVRDVLGAIEHLKAECGCTKVALAGYSFGAAVALNALAQSQAVCFVAVALPTEMGREYYANLPVEVSVPALVAAGDTDEICRLEQVERIASFALPPKKVLLRGCDHFFSNLESLGELCENVTGFLEETLGSTN
jgi:alpha/beta superfamily hydrolase